MYTGPFIGLLDTWVGILQELNAEDYTRILLTPHGGRVTRIGELKNEGLIVSRHGKLGGHKLTASIDDIPFSRLLALRDLRSCPTTSLLYRYEDFTLGEILAMPIQKRVSWASGIGVVVSTLSQLSHTIPQRHSLVRAEGVSEGYKQQILHRIYRQGLTISENGQIGRGNGRTGVLLYKPFSQFTVGDILPLLSSSRPFYNRLLTHSRSLKLEKLLVGGGRK